MTMVRVCTCLVLEIFKLFNLMSFSERQTTVLGKIDHGEMSEISVVYRKGTVNKVKVKGM